MLLKISFILQVAILALLSTTYAATSIISSTPQNITVEVTPPPFTQKQLTYNQVQYDDIDIPGYYLTSEVAKPSLPFHTVTFGVPLEASVIVHLDSVTFKEIENINIIPAETLVYDETNEITPYKSVLIEDPSVYKVNGLYPVSWYKYNGEGFIRSQRVGQLIIFPTRFNPVTRKMLSMDYLKVTIEFVGSKEGSFVDEKNLEKVYKNLLVNYEVAKNYRKKRAKQEEDQNIFSHSSAWYKISLEDDGIYKIDYNYLTSHGISPGSIDYSSLRLFNLGGKELPSDFTEHEFPEFEEVPLYTVGEGDNSFDESDYFMFWGNSLNGWEIEDDGDFRYFKHFLAENNVYWLTFNGSFPEAAKRIPSITAEWDYDTIITTGWTMKHWEYDYVWITKMQWLWGEFQTKTFWLSDDKIVRNTEAYFSSSPTSSSVYVNDETATFSGTADAFVSNELVAGSNEIEYRFNNTASTDYFEVEYEFYLNAQDSVIDFAYRDSIRNVIYEISNIPDDMFLFDVTDRFNVRKFDNITEGGVGSVISYIFTDTCGPQRIYGLTPSKVKSPVSFEEAELAGLRDTTNRGEYVIIYPQMFEYGDYCDPSQLIEFRETYDSLSVISVTLDKVYDEFGGGLKDLTAIRDFLRYAYDFWNEPPMYAVFVGDGNYDYNNILNSPEVYFPPCGKANNFTDDWYGNIVAGSSSYPDIGIGRLPANSQFDLRVMMDKIIQYQQNPIFGDWRNKYLLCADDEYKGLAMDDLSLAEAHTRDTDELWNRVPRYGEILPLYLIEYPRISSGLKPAAREDFIDYINEGVMVANWMGHGNYHLLSHEAMFDGNSDIQMLYNDYIAPLFLAASCEVGKYYYPLRQCICEELFRRNGGGSIASLGATARTGAPDNESFNRGVYYELFIQDETEPLGWAVANGKANSLSGSSYILFGDPALVLGLPRWDARITSMNPSYINAGGFCQIHGRIYKNDEHYNTFQGTALIKVFDSIYDKTYVSPDVIVHGENEYEIIINYRKPGNMIFNGEVEVEDGAFECSFNVPVDVSLGDSLGKIIVYAYNDYEDAVGGRDSLIISESTTSICEGDSMGPEIQVFLESETFQSGDYVNPDPLLIIKIEDQTGINITGALGHCITMILDRDNFNTVNLSPEFKYTLNSYTSGTISYRLENLSQGYHIMHVTAWDNCGNSSTEIVEFEITPKELRIEKLLPYPNPFKNGVNITFELSVEAEVDISVFTLSGKLVKNIKKISSRIGFNNVYWDGKDKDGEDIANGVYLVKVFGKSDYGDISEFTKIGKIK
ncbi:type IX secretion system sortase PorU [bacterium]|nr:type IX secretion system sortase PorU [bacterium]